MKKFRALFIETMTVTPHTETGLELAHLLSELEYEIIYCPLFASSIQQYWTSPIGGTHSEQTVIEDWLPYVVRRLPRQAKLEIFSCETPLIPNINTTKILSEYQFLNKPFGLLVFNFLKELTKDLFWFTSPQAQQYLVLASKLLQQSIKSYLIACALIDQHKPSHMVLFNGRTPSTQPIVWAATEKSIQLIIHERGPNKDKYELFDDIPGKLAVSREKILKFAMYRAATIALKNATEFFARLRNNQPLHWSSFTENQHKFTHEISQDYVYYRDKVVYFLSSDDEQGSILEETTSGPLGTQAETLVSVANVCTDLGLSLVVRFHPYQAQKISELNFYKDLCSTLKVNIIDPSSSINSLMLGIVARKALVFNSNIAWELMFIGKSVGLLGKSIGSGEDGVLELNSISEVAEFISGPEVPSVSNFPTKYGDFMMESGYNYKLFQATDRSSGYFPLSC